MQCTRRFVMDVTQRAAVDRALREPASIPRRRATAHRAPPPHHHSPCAASPGPQGNNSLVGSIPAGIGQMTQLTRLDLSSNRGLWGKLPNMM